MSRSYKKTPVCIDGKSGRVGKKLANRKVRRYKGIIPNGKSYKKLYESWEIHDFVSRVTYKEEQKKFESDFKSYLNGPIKKGPKCYIGHSWEKYYYRKQIKNWGVAKLERHMILNHVIGGSNPSSPANMACW